LAEYTHDRSTIASVLRHRAEVQTNQTAWVFLKENGGNTEACRVSYGELDRLASNIAFHLLQRAKPGDRALLLHPQSIDFLAAFFGCLYAGIVPIPAYPPRPGRGDLRIQAIAADAEPTLGLTSSPLLSRCEAQFQGQGAPRIPAFVATDLLPLEHGRPVNPAASSNDIAWLQYTSGSTSTPKGVIVTYGNLASNLREMDGPFRHTPESIMLTWLPMFHDMGLIFGALLPLHGGFPCYMMAPAAFLQRPVRWLQAISDYRATHSAGPNFAYDLCARRIRPAERTSLDLSHWAVAVNGSEPVRRSTVESFIEVFAPYGFRRESFIPGFGLAEGTLKVTTKAWNATPKYLAVSGSALESHRVEPATDPRDERIVAGCGWSSPETAVEIVNPQTRQRCPPDQVGEIWISGPSVAKGYWNRPAESALTFGATIDGAPDRLFLRTGDLGFAFEGELYVTGRIKDMIIIRGQNHYPHDIEETVERCHPALRAGHGIAFSLDVDNEERLVIAQEIEPRFKQELNVEDLIEIIRENVSEAHDLNVYSVLLLQPGEVPRTSSGKLQRSACRKAFLSGALKRWNAEKPMAETVASESL
jgi:acyl-CoA synthetase (AMP-forming)/AMP-acid ligase II